MLQVRGTHGYVASCTLCIARGITHGFTWSVAIYIHVVRRYPTWYSGFISDNEWLIGKGMALDPEKYFIIVPCEYPEYPQHLEHP